MTLTIEIQTKPIPKQRPRRGRGGRFYTPRKTREFENFCKLRALVEVRQCKEWSKAERYRVTVDCFFPDKRRRDVDNAAKSILDAFNGIVWNDDDQVVEVTVRKDIDRENPRAVAVVEVLK